VQISFPEQTALFRPNNNHLVALRPEPDFDLRSTEHIHFERIQCIMQPDVALTLRSIDGFI
jgi:hypothetical protein